eukprot:TRINITY_DN55269_c0_g1_i1.p1 TRINITY_DN55269_c0_g1~~TRINITY_DN55269_c0_g1_i1.p1  ORF type:complete len:492 (+),score=54.64 TRINITY_DN55269_c0_g1_i1:150-1625(+)
MIDGKNVRNGFFVRDEPPSLVVAQENVAVYSWPEEMLRFTPSAELITHKFPNGDCERKIHCNTELSVVEMEQLKVLQDEARQANMVFYPSVSVMATRFLSRGRGDAKRALTLMTETQAWREKYFSGGPIVDASIVDDLRHGIVYFVGRDKDLRPTIVCRANRIPEQWYKEKAADRLIRIIVFCMEYMVRYMLAPGKVEGNNLIVDLKGIGPTQVPFTELKKLYSVTSHHYIGRVFKFYIVNMSYWFSSFSGLVMKMLTDRQRQKITIVSDISALRNDYALHQLEEDHGGSRPTIKEFFPFPVQPGPFDAGNNAPSATAVPLLHTVFLPTSLQGHLWDPSKSYDENTRMEFAVGSSDILKKCGLDVLPEDAAANEKDDEKTVDVIKPAASEGSINGSVRGIEVVSSREDELRNIESDVYEKSCKTHPTSVVMSNGAKVPTPNVSRTTAPQEEDAKSDMEVQEPVIQSSEVKPAAGFFGSFFSCRCCKLADSH